MASKIFAIITLLPSFTNAQTHVAWARSPGSSGGPPGGRASMAYAQQSLAGESGGALADVLWMYGGISAAQPLNYSSELWGYTASTSLWERVVLPGSPPPLVGASMCSVGHFLYLYGGSNFDASANENLYSFDTARRQWSLMSLLGYRPPARAYHTLTCAGGRVYLFGGADASGTVYNTMAYLDNLNTINMRWHSPPAAGNVPSPRKSHSLSHGQGGKLYLFGGSGAADEKLNDVYTLDATSLSWYAMSTTGVPPTPREGHTGVVMDNKLYVFGGSTTDSNLNDVRVLDLSSLSWSHPRSSGDPPPPRWGHVGALVNQQLFLYGGVSERQNLLSDMWQMSRHCVGRIELTATRSTFVSGEGTYQANTQCEWHISPNEANKQVRLFFSSFGLEQGHDFVNVYDGSTTSHPLVGRFTGDSLPQPVGSSNGTLLVVLSTDAATNDIGFTASYFSECAAGFVPSTSGTPGSNERCMPCSAGKFADRPGLTECKRCDIHSYNPIVGQSQCLACPAATRAPYEGAARVSECGCYPGFHAPDGPGGDCVACPVGATCPGGVPAIAKPGFCRNTTALMAPCCDPAACPGGSEAVCPDGIDVIGEPGAETCVDPTYLTWWSLRSFIASVSTIGLTCLICFCFGHCRGRRVGQIRALRDYATRLREATAAPQIGSYTESLAAETTFNPDLPANFTTGPSFKERVPIQPRAARRQSSFTPTGKQGPPAQLPPKDTGPALAAYEEVGLTLVDLEGAHAEEARLMPPSRDGSIGREHIDGGGTFGGPPVMHLEALQHTESDLIEASSHGSDGASPEEPQPPPAPPTPPRNQRIAKAQPVQEPQQSPGGAGGEGGYVGTCLVQVPDADGRWQPVKLTASMAGSPVGSINPSLAPSESTIGGRSLRMLRGVGAESIPEDYEWEENEPGA